MTITEQIQAIKSEKHFWSQVLEEATKDEILDLAKRMDIYTHHEDGRQRELESLKAIIAYNKEHEFRDALRKKYKITIKNLELLSGKELVSYLFSLDDEKEIERVEFEIHLRYFPDYINKLYRDYKNRM